MNVRVLVFGTLIVAAALRPAAGGSATDNQQDGAQTRPRLIVMFVVDQMRSDYLDVFANRWKRGFATLRSEGAVFDRAEYPYMNTVTCPGHATIGTGTFPHVHALRHGAHERPWRGSDPANRGCRPHRNR
jgi:predicted AlkP superfamily pyrophosphatase or phosphodiesterase